MKSMITVLVVFCFAFCPLQVFGEFLIVENQLEYETSCATYFYCDSRSCEYVLTSCGSNDSGATLSNILNSMHELAMHAVRNIS